MNKRLLRLCNDYRDLDYLNRRSEIIDIDVIRGNPPEVYKITYRFPGIWKRAEEIVQGDIHILEIVLPFDYPSSMPLFRFEQQSPVFHPNVAPPNHPTMPPYAVCLVDNWSAGQSLLELVIRTGKMICYQNYNLSSTLNGQATLWVRDNANRLPLVAFDFDSFLVSAPKDYVTSLILDNHNGISDSTTTDTTRQSTRPTREHSYYCQNCHSQSSEQGLMFCSNGHEVCNNCIEKCALCGKLLCVLCEEMVVLDNNSGICCKNCFLSYDSNTTDMTRQSTRPTREHSYYCQNCHSHSSEQDLMFCANGHKVCSNCIERCALCGKLLCVLCEEMVVLDNNSGVCCKSCSLSYEINISRL